MGVQRTRVYNLPSKPEPNPAQFPCPHCCPCCRPPAEAELRRAFLQRREAWIAGLVAELDDSHAYELLKRLTDVYRLHLFDVVMQYRAIFSDDHATPGDQVRWGVLRMRVHGGCKAVGSARAHGVV